MDAQPRAAADAHRWPLAHVRMGGPARYLDRGADRDQRADPHAGPNLDAAPHADAIACSVTLPNPDRQRGLSAPVSPAHGKQCLHLREAVCTILAKGPLRLACTAFGGKQAAGRAQRTAALRRELVSPLRIMVKSAWMPYAATVTECEA